MVEVSRLVKIHDFASKKMIEIRKWHSRNLSFDSSVSQNCSKEKMKDGNLAWFRWGRLVARDQNFSRTRENVHALGVGTISNRLFLAVVLREICDDNHKKSYHGLPRYKFHHSSVFAALKKRGPQVKLTWRQQHSTGCCLQNIFPVTTVTLPWRQWGAENSHINNCAFPSPPGQRKCS